MLECRGRSASHRVCESGNVHLAYQVVGHGSLDLVWIESWVHQVESFWEIPRARQRRRLAAMGRQIIFDDVRLI